MTLVVCETCILAFIIQYWLIHRLDVGRIAIDSAWEVYGFSAHSHDRADAVLTLVWFMLCVQFTFADVSFYYIKWCSGWLAKHGLCFSRFVFTAAICKLVSSLSD